MARGKLILICQSGGEFVTNADGNMSYTGGEANAANINHETLFDDLKLEVAETCNLDQKTVSIKYFLPGNKRNLITVKNDKDVKRMIDFHSSSITADVFITGTAGFDRSALKVNASRSTSTKEEGPVSHGVPSTPASPSPAKRTRHATAKAAAEPVVRAARHATAKAAAEPAVRATRRATAKAAVEIVVPATRRTTRSSAKAAADVDSEGPTDTVVSSDDNSKASNRETSPSTSPSEKADDRANSDSGSDYVPSRSGRKPNSRIDVNTSPADTVKKRRRTASWRFGANGPTIVSARDDDSRETKARRKSYMAIVDSSAARKSLRKSSRIASDGDDSRERKSRKKIRRNQSSLSLADESDHSVDILIRDEDGFDNPSPIAIWDDDVTPESLVATWKGAITGVGQEFKSVHEFRDALQRYAVANRFAYKLKKNDTIRAIGGCVAEGCSWKIHAAWVPASQSFKIKVLNNVHTCDKESRRSAHPNKNWLVSTIKERLQNSPHQKPKEIANGILRDFGVELNYTQVWRGLEDAREQLHGSPKESYNKLPWFCEKILETNPGSFSKLIIGEEKRFQSLFVSFYASICGFQRGCRPLVFLEATSLKSKYQEVLLTANAIDGNDGFFPVAFAVVDVENDDKWHWFLELLKSVISDSKPITFVSDRDKNLKKSVLDVFENAHHGYSMYHLLESFKRNAKGPFHGDGRGFLPVHFLAAAQAVRLGAFKKSTEQIKLISSQSYDWVMQIEAQHWATYSFKGERYNYITQDVGEPYAKLMEESRELPILHKIDALIRMVADLMEDARLDASLWSTKLTPSKEQILQEENLKARGLKVLISSDTLFEVREDLTHVVNTSNWSCTCLGWKETGLPCRHALAVFTSTGKNAYDYCSKYFTVDFYRSTYFESVFPVPIDGKPMEVEKGDSIAEGKPVEKEKGDSTMDGNPVESDEGDIVDENPVEKEVGDSTVEIEEGDSTADGKPVEKEGVEIKVGDSTVDWKLVEEGEGEKGEVGLIGDGKPVEKEVGEEKEGESTVDGHPVEKEGGDEKEGEATPEKGEGEEKEDGLTVALMGGKKDKGEKKEADDPNVLVLPPIPSKAPVQEKEKVEWKETEEEGKRTESQ